MNDTLTQNQAILAYLEQGHSLTPLEALDRFGCNRLAARCWELKLQGWEIETTRVRTATGKRVASYRLLGEQERFRRVVLA